MPPISYIFWFIYLLWFIFGAWEWFPAEQRTPARIGRWFFEFVLIGLLGWAVFYNPK